MTDRGSFTDMLISLHPSLFRLMGKSCDTSLFSCYTSFLLPSSGLLVFPDWCLLSAIVISPECVFICRAVWNMRARESRRGGFVALRYANIMLMVLCKRLNCCQFKAIRNSSVWCSGFRWGGVDAAISLQRSALYMELCSQVINQFLAVGLTFFSHWIAQFATQHVKHWQFYSA